MTARNGGVRGTVHGAADDVRLALRAARVLESHLKSATHSHQPLPGGLELRANRLRRIVVRNLCADLAELAVDIDLVELRGKRERRRWAKARAA